MQKIADSLFIAYGINFNKQLTQMPKRQAAIVTPDSRLVKAGNLTKS